MVVPMTESTWQELVDDEFTLSLSEKRSTKVTKGDGYKWKHWFMLSSTVKFSLHDRVIILQEFTHV